MKASCKAITILAAATSAIAGPVAINGVLTGAPPPTFQALRPRETSTCNADNILRDLRNPTRPAAASSFCSTYLQPTAVATSTAINSVTQISVASSTSTTLITTIQTTTLASPTVTCAAAPTGPLTCGFEAFGYSTYLISQTAGIADYVVCHELCLANPSCRSFQIETGGGQFCNLYNTVTAGNVLAEPGQGYFFYDRDCSNYQPAGCPTHSLFPRGVEAKRAVPVPTYLATVPADRISSACSCFISSPDPTITSTALATITVSTTTTSIHIVPATQVLTSEATAFVTSFVTAAP